MKRRMFAAFLAAGVLTAALPLEAAAMEESKVRELAEQVGEAYGICPELLQAIAWRESNYQEKAEGTGCSGLMQVAEHWHRERMEKLQVKDLYNPEGNMLVAADYLAELFEKYEDPGMVLMVYNGDSRAEEYQQTGELSAYAAAILEKSAQLERAHGK